MAVVVATTSLAAGLRQIATRRLRRRVQELELDRQIRGERERISRDLHDNVGSQVATILAGIELAQLRAGADDRGRVNEQLAALREDARRTMAQLHETVWSLHHEQVTVAALADQVHEHLRDRQRHVMRPRLHSEALGDQGLALPSAHALHLFRIVQEGVSNAIRHSGAANVRVTVTAREDEAVQIEILDDGEFRAPAPGHPGVGIPGMRTRAASIGGTFELGPAVPEGTSIRVVLPLARSRGVP
jgi:signal transduction histidine kinase